MFATAFKTETGLVKLFQLISDKKEHDEKMLRKKTGIKNITEGRSRLRKLLFKAMRNYREDASPRQQLRDAHSDIEFLEKKKLKNEASKEINKAIKLAEANDEFPMLYYLLECSARNMATTINPEVLLPRLMELERQVEHSIEEGAYLLKTLMISNTLAGILNSANFTSPDELKNQVTGLKDRIQMLLPKAKTVYTRVLLLSIHIFCDAESNISEPYYTEVLELYKQNPGLISRQPFMYDNFLNIYCRQIVSKKEDMALAGSLFQKIETSRSDNSEYLKQHPDRLVRMRKKLSWLKLLYCRANSLWVMVPGLEKQIRLELEQEPGKEDIVNASNLSTLISCLYSSGNYVKALEWTNIFYSMPEANFRKPLMIGVRMLETLSFFRLKEFDVSETKGINLYKTITEQRYTDDYHKHLTTVLRKLNSWNLKVDKDRNEMKQLAGYFAALRKNEDLQYHTYSDVLNPEEILEDLLK